MKLIEQVTPYLEFCEYRKKLDTKSIKAYRIDLKQFFNYLNGREPDKILIESYITELHKRFKQKTVKRKLASMKAFFNYLEEEEILEYDNPFRKIKVKFKETSTLPRIIPRRTIEELLNYMYVQKKETEKKHQNHILRDLAVMEVFFATGARVYEISNLKMDSVDLSSGLIRIMGKGRKERYIQIGNSSILKLLKDYYKMYKKEIKQSGYFFVNRLGNRYTEQSIRLMMRKYTKAAGIEQHITPHMFRHSFATYLIEEGVDISYVQRILGHSSIKTTQIYIYVASKKQAEILRTMHPRNKMNISTAV